jgi:excisionase family DNA binding protein
MSVAMLADRGTQRDHRMSNPVPKRLLTIKEAAQYLSLSVYSVREMIWRGVFPYIKREGGRKYLLDIRDLDEFIDSQKASYAA